MEKETIICKFQVPEVGIPVLDVMLTAAEQELIAAFPEGKELRKEELADLADGIPGSVCRGRGKFGYFFGHPVFQRDPE